jgi:hypothetical protein
MVTLHFGNCCYLALPANKICNTPDVNMLKNVGLFLTFFSNRSFRNYRIFYLQHYCVAECFIIIFRVCIVLFPVLCMYFISLYFLMLTLQLAQVAVR